MRASWRWSWFALLTAVVRSKDARNPLLFYSICAFDRKQHVHLKRLVAEAASMCEGGLRVRLRIYTADGTDGTANFTAFEADELSALARCGGALGGRLAFSVEARPGELRKVLTMEHRREFAAELASPSPGASADDLFLFTEDDVLVRAESQPIQDTFYSRVPERIFRGALSGRRRTTRSRGPAGPKKPRETSSI